MSSEDRFNLEDAAEALLLLSGGREGAGVITTARKLGEHRIARGLNRHRHLIAFGRRSGLMAADGAFHKGMLLTPVGDRVPLSEKYSCDVLDVVDHFCTKDFDQLSAKRPKAVRFMGQSVIGIECALAILGPTIAVIMPMTVAANTRSLCLPPSVKEVVIHTSLSALPIFPFGGGQLKHLTIVLPSVAYEEAHSFKFLYSLVSSLPQAFVVVVAPAEAVHHLESTGADVTRWLYFTCKQPNRLEIRSREKHRQALGKTCWELGMELAGMTEHRFGNSTRGLPEHVVNDVTATSIKLNMPNGMNINMPSEMNINIPNRTNRTKDEDDKELAETDENVATTSTRFDWSTTYSGSRSWYRQSFIRGS